MKETFYDFCERTGETILLGQWDVERNGALTPKSVSHGSRSQIWWRCERGHTWQSAVYTRTDGSGCPYCAGKRAWPGESDLASRYPDLAAQWHPTKNGTLTPEQVLPGGHQKVWWICEKGHQWQAVVKSRVSGCGCPVCTNRELAPGDNDLAAAFPVLAAQWDQKKNGKLTPQDVVPGTRRKVWWVCRKGHEWQATVASRTVGGAGCPVCAGKKIVVGENDLATLFPQIAAQWNAEKNGKLRPSAVSAYSNRRVWWRCELGHDWQTAISARTMHGNGCPVCAGKRVLAGFNDLASQLPDLAAQWEPNLNGSLTPEMVTAGSHRKVWWQCPSGHIWKSVIYSRAGPQRSGCPICAGRKNKKRQRRYAALTEEAPVVTTVGTEPSGPPGRQGGISR